MLNGDSHLLCRRGREATWDKLVDTPRDRDSTTSLLLNVETKSLRGSLLSGEGLSALPAVRMMEDSYRV